MGERTVHGETTLRESRGNKAGAWLMSEHEWTIDDYLDKLFPYPREQLSKSFAKSSCDVIQDKDVSDEMLHESYIVMAEIVQFYGLQYLPIFERLHEEIDSRQKKRELLDAALKAATGGVGPSL